MRETFYPGVVSLALLSDLHARPYENVIRSLQRHKPELIAITGDIVYGSFPVDDKSPLVTQTNVLPFLAACTSIAPTYLSLGNHEQMLDEEDIATIQQTGVTVLDNEWKELILEGRKIVIGGLSSEYVTEYQEYRKGQHGARYPRKENISSEERKPRTDWLAEYAAQPGYHILLSHHPEYYDQIPQSVDLVLSGHAHDGQWNYYSFRKRRACGIFAPGQGFFPKYTSGFYDRMIVSRGLSNTARIPRIFNPTEIVYIGTEKKTK